MNNFAEIFIKYIFFIIGALLVFDLLLFYWVSRLRHHYKSIFQSPSGKQGGNDLEKVLLELKQNEIAFGSALKEVVKRIENVEGELPKDLRRVGLVRYNPFSGTGAGGDQSFALALLNELNDGIVVSSIYGREMNRVYAKQIKGGKSNYQLTGEENQAIAEAK